MKSLFSNIRSTWARTNRRRSPISITTAAWTSSRGKTGTKLPRGPGIHFRDILFTNNYIDDFSDLPLDVNGDGYPDVVSCGWFSKSLWWDENPGRNTNAKWKRHEIQSGFNIEFCFAVDLDNDGKAHEILPEFGNASAPALLVVQEIEEQATSSAIIVSDKIIWPRNRRGGSQQRRPHGPYSPPRDGSRLPIGNSIRIGTLGETGFIYVHDVNGDGRPDLVTSLAHNYGIFWMEQTADGKWKKHVIDESWSQSHAMTMVDLNGDGKPDFLTGKRFMAHNGRDPGEREPLGVYWYEYRSPDAGGNGRIKEP